MVYLILNIYYFIVVLFIYGLWVPIFAKLGGDGFNLSFMNIFTPQLNFILNYFSYSLHLCIPCSLIHYFIPSSYISVHFHTNILGPTSTTIYYLFVSFLLYLPYVDINLVYSLWTYKISLCYVSSLFYPIL